MSLLSYIYPQTIARFTSPYNKDIRVVEEHARYKILVNGSPQSGPYIENLWKRACQSFGIPQKHVPRSILVLGIAGGTVIHLLRHWYPKARITAIDIDKTMIDIGKKFFELDRINNLILKKADAKNFIHQTKQKYDLVIVDLSFGRNIPTFVSMHRFLSAIKKLRTHQGVIIINFLREKEYREISDTLKNTLLQIFATVREKPIFLNRFFFAQ